MLILKKESFNQIVRHSKEESPNEACGILAGKDDTVYKVYEMENSDKSPESFFVEPREQLRIMKEIRSSGLEMVGVYHSHLASQAYPSTRDLELAFYPDISYAIISLKDKENPQIRSFKIQDNKISEEEVEIK